MSTSAEGPQSPIDAGRVLTPCDNPLCACHDETAEVTVCPDMPFRHRCRDRMGCGHATCRHCGYRGPKGEDHTCPCPFHDNDCTEHPTAPARVSSSGAGGVECIYCHAVQTHRVCQPCFMGLGTTEQTHSEAGSPSSSEANPSPTP